MEIKQQIMLTTVSIITGLLLGGFLINRIQLNEMNKKVELMEVKWQVMLEMSSTEARTQFDTLVNERIK